MLIGLANIAKPTSGFPLTISAASRSNSFTIPLIADLKWGRELFIVSTLREVLNQHVREGDLYDPIDRNRIRCFACGHCCPILAGQPGVCKVRYNQGGKLYAPSGYDGRIQGEQIEKN